ncbi:MAG: S46 family peptidase [Bdellovibrionaceae bacterium]|nr:S46 family peptidase [Bdellovibrionales bacterium]MCB9254000.1 S46 family peptidase [Pseudobdellovibrionaceae bacterium]
MGKRIWGLASLLLIFIVVSCSRSDSTQQPAQFENQGGMWMPVQMGAHADTLRTLGLSYDPKQLTDPLAHPLGAIVWLGGCSASFVSKTGLIITNHHCIQSALQYNNGDANLIENGYLAKSPAEELWAGPGSHVFVTTAFTDVTSTVLKDIEKIEGDEARYEEIKKRINDLTEACEVGKTDTRCQVSSFFEGAQFFQIEQLEIKDVRLVYSPHQGVGFFGGFDDNWRWPRQAGDYGFLRAYVGPDGKPAEYSPENVPYVPKHTLKLPSQALNAGDLVMVTGYPGTTDRFKTADEVADDVHYDLPRRVSLNSGFLDVLEALSAENAEFKSKTHSLRFGLENYKQFYTGALEGLEKGGLLQQKQKIENELRKWIAADPERQEKYGDVFEKMTAKRNEYLKTRNRDQAFVEVLDRSARPELNTFRGMNLLKAAFILVRKAKESQKPDPERLADFQERNWPKIEQGQEAFQKEYARRIDRQGMKFFLERVAAMPEQDRPAIYNWIVGDNSLEAGLDLLYENPESSLEDLATRKKLLSAKLEDLNNNLDPFIQLAIKLLPEVEALEKRLGAFKGGLAAIRPRYVEALVAFQGGLVAPDANSTLRVSFGTVRGYSPKPDAPVYEPFTMLPSMIAKFEKFLGVEPYNAPENLMQSARAAVQTGDYGIYKSERLGGLPVDFLADLDITGGNSGSATLNAKGEIVGLAFDGNYEAMASDWIFMPAITRSIHVDIRYVLWIMQYVDGAGHLIREMRAQ